jgi:hypothetical protein
MRKILRASIKYFYLGFAYLILVAIFGECHPFTHYPMFSSFPNYADYYYVEDENGHPLSTIRTFHRATSEIKDLFSISMNNRGLDVRQLESNIAVAPEVGTILVKSVMPAVKARQINIIYVSLWHEADSIKLHKEKIYSHDL